MTATGRFGITGIIYNFRPASTPDSPLIRKLFWSVSQVGETQTKVFFPPGPSRLFWYVPRKKDIHTGPRLPRPTHSDIGHTSPKSTTFVPHKILSKCK